MGWLIILLIVGYLGYRYFNLDSSLPKSGTLNSTGSRNVSYDGELPGPGEFDFDIVGESHYQENLEELAGGRGEESAEINVIAVLSLENSNKYDKNAVRVDIDGLTVGYLSRDDAIDYRKKIAAAGAADKTLACKAMIVGGWNRGKDKGHFGVKLDLPTE